MIREYNSNKMSEKSSLEQRRSVRLKEYNYSLAGLYFITMCTQNRVCLFGNVRKGEMILNDAGKIIEKWYYELENKFPDIRCDAMIIMPNHFHCIIKNVGTDLVSTEKSLAINDIAGEHIGSNLHRVVQWFKTISTNEYIRGVKTKKWKPFDGKLWQRNYWEHVIRNEDSYHAISDYIINNPTNWNKDELFNSKK